MAHAESLTGQYLSGRRQIEMPRLRHSRTPSAAAICGRARQQSEEHHVELPVGLFVCVTGVSGSGKSTLINDTLYHAVARTSTAAPPSRRRSTRSRSSSSSTRW